MTTSVLTTMQEIPLWPDAVPGRIQDGQPEVSTNREGILRVEHVHVPALYAFPADPRTNTGTAVVICPGGGYGIVAIEHEGFDVARWFNTLGVNAFVLKYRMSPYRHPIPLMDAQRALRIVRDQATSWGLRSDRIGVMGFSAGGHLATTLATHADQPAAPDPELGRVSCRPDFVVLGYPVVSLAEPEIAHTGSRRNLLGPVEDAAAFRELSAELQVTADSPPTFLFHARDDTGALPQHSRLLAAALQRLGVPAELILLDQGGHGFGLRRDAWTTPCAQWLRQLGLITCRTSTPRPDHSRVPGTVIDHVPAWTGTYIGSPSLTVLPDGSYLATHDVFGPSVRSAGVTVTRVFASNDRGASWCRLGDVRDQGWSSLFVHDKAVYLMGTSGGYGNAVIRRSVDGGRTWTTPLDESSGLLLQDARYHCAPVPVVPHRGRVWRAMEDGEGPSGWGRCFRAFMMSAPLDADLLEARNWTRSNALGHDASYLGGDFGGWLEGNAVIGPDGDLVNVLRSDFRKLPEMASIMRISADGTRADFDPDAGFVEFPGGCKKFTIRFDQGSERYWSLTNFSTQYFAHTNVERTRNTVTLVTSSDLRQWRIQATLLHHEDPTKHAFQYLDWQFDGPDIVAVSRTAYDDGLGGAHSMHDANYLTFHRFRDFRAWSRPAITPDRL